MADMSYVFGNLRTGTVITTIPLGGVSMSRTLNEAGTLRANFTLDMTGYDNIDLVNATVPGQSFCIVERDNVPVWGGIVVACTYQSQAKNYQMVCREWGIYTERRRVASDFAMTDDKRNIFIGLWNHMQANSEGNLGVTVPSPVTAVNNATLAMYAAERKMYAAGMSAMADGDDGFDWTIDTIKNGTSYEKVLRIGYPTIGNNDSGLLQFEYPGNILNYYSTVGIGGAGTHIGVLGEGEGSSMLVGTYVDQAKIDSGQWLRWDYDIARKYLNTQSQVDEHALTEGVKRSAPLHVVKIECKAELDPVFGSYGLGDACRTIITDARFPNTLQIDTRLVSWEYWPLQEDGSEEVHIVFVGDELNGE